VAITKFLARDLTFEVQDAAGTGWLPIGGLQSISHSPASTNADTTDFDSNGHARHIPAQRGDSFALAGQALEDVTNGDVDPGQARCEELALLTGLNAMGSFRVTSAGGNVKMFDGSAEVTLPGGGTNDAASWACTVTVDGEITPGP
jgi:hypothetical protein